MGAAPMAWALWSRHLRHAPQEPTWLNRDRFILSAGHGSMLLYGLLFATGYDVTMDDLKRFRQLGSRTPGHPENSLTPGVEMATGPLGQGVATAVGMAIAEEFLAAKLNKPEFDLINHHTYVLCSDGDLMEGVAQEACSLAGHLKLGKLIMLYDDNQITIDGSTDLAFTENTGAKFEALGWQVIRVKDGMDVDQVDAAIREAQADLARPSLIICPTVIGYGSPNKAGSAKSHGSPLGTEELAATKAALGLPDEPFYFPEEAKEEFRRAREAGQKRLDDWNATLADFEQKYPEDAKTLRAARERDFDLSALKALKFETALSTRQANGECLNAVAQKNPFMLTGSADLAENVFTVQKGFGGYQAGNRSGRNISFGVREHAMAAALNGITLHGGCLAAGGTFLIFSDYCKPSIRLAALMQIPTIFLFSHDSIGVGEDGPTHQPVEQLLGLRAIPNLNVMRPADANEMAACWQVALGQSDTPSVLVSSRQTLPIVTPAGDSASKGAYILFEPPQEPEFCLVGTGSEVSICLEAAQKLLELGRPTRVVSMPSWYLFEQQDEEYQDEVLQPYLPTMSVEAGTDVGWSRYAQLHLAVTTFGESGPGPMVMEEFGFTAENIVAEVVDFLQSVDSLEIPELS